MELLVLFFPIAVGILFAETSANQVARISSYGGDITYHRRLQNGMLWLMLGYFAGFIAGNVIVTVLQIDPTSHEHIRVATVWAYLGLAAAGIGFQVYWALNRALRSRGYLVVGLLVTVIGSAAAWAIKYRLPQL